MTAPGWMRPPGRGTRPTPTSATSPASSPKPPCLPRPRRHPRPATPRRRSHPHPAARRAAARSRRDPAAAAAARFPAAPGRLHVTDLPHERPAQARGGHPGAVALPVRHPGLHPRGYRHPRADFPEALRWVLAITAKPRSTRSSTASGRALPHRAWDAASGRRGRAGDAPVAVQDDACLSALGDQRDEHQLLDAVGVASVVQLQWRSSGGLA